jgi:hypothetical protein
MLFGCLYLAIPVISSTGSLSLYNEHEVLNEVLNGIHRARPGQLTCQVTRQLSRKLTIFRKPAFQIRHVLHWTGPTLLKEPCSAEKKSVGGSFITEYTLFHAHLLTSLSLKIIKVHKDVYDFLPLAM